jgi:hypothetical protein
MEPTDAGRNFRNYWERMRLREQAGDIPTALGEEMLELMRVWVREWK